MGAILHTYRTYYPDDPGGLQEAIRQISFSTAKFGSENQIFTLSKKPTPARVVRPEGEVIRRRSWVTPSSCDIGGLSAFTTFAKLAKQSDVLHYHFPWPFGDLLHIVSSVNVPAIMTYHSDIVRQQILGKLYEPLMNKMLDSMQVIVATSPAYIESSEILSKPAIRNKVAVIPLGIDENTYAKTPDNGVFTRCGINQHEPYFLFLGVLRYYKGLGSLIKAAKSVGAQIVIAGSGPETNNLGTFAEQENISNVIFTGQVTESEKTALLANCYTFVLPSHLRSEAFGMVLVEAEMFGKPMITCEIGTGTSYVNLHEETGLVVSPDQPTALANAMTALLADESMTKAMGQAARKRYDAHFSGEVMGKAYQRIYDSLL